MRKNAKKLQCCALWLHGSCLINLTVFNYTDKIRKPGWPFRIMGMTSDFVSRRRTAPTAAAPDGAPRRMLNTTGECREPKRDPRKLARVPGTDAATTATRGAVRGPVCPPSPADRSAGAGAGTAQSATTRQDNRNSALRWRRSVPAPPTRRVSPTRPIENAGRYRRPNPGRKG